MKVIRSCVMLTVFAHVKRGFRISFRAVHDVPYAVSLGGTFMRYQRIISFREIEGFGLTLEPPWMSLQGVIDDWNVLCAVQSTADNAQSLENPTRIMLKCLLDADEESLD